MYRLERRGTRTVMQRPSTNQATATSRCLRFTALNGGAARERTPSSTTSATVLVAARSMVLHAVLENLRRAPAEAVKLRCIADANRLGSRAQRQVHAGHHRHAGDVDHPLAAGAAGEPFDTRTSTGTASASSLLNSAGSEQHAGQRALAAQNGDDGRAGEERHQQRGAAADPQHRHVEPARVDGPRERAGQHRGPARSRVRVAP